MKTIIAAIIIALAIGGHAVVVAHDGIATPVDVEIVNGDCHRASWDCGLSPTPP